MPVTQIFALNILHAPSWHLFNHNPYSSSPTSLSSINRRQ